MGVGARASTLALIALIVTPAAIADHCGTGIAIFGRSALAPGFVPPPSPVRGYCVAFESSFSPGHLLAPGSDQIFVRVEFDLGPNYKKLHLRLEGLGFEGGQQYELHRVPSLVGRATYELDDWLTLPDAPGAQGELRATVRYPGGGEASTEYTLLGPGSVPTEPGLP